MKNLFTILLISLFLFSCDKDRNPLTSSNEIDVDWFLVKTPFYYDSVYTPEGENSLTEGIGYHFYYTGSSNLIDLNMFMSNNDHVIFNDESGGILSFSYENEVFSFDLSDSYDLSIEMYRIRTMEEITNFNVQRIIYNQNMNYFTLFGPEGSMGISLNSSYPNELIGYR